MAWAQTTPWMKAVLMLMAISTVLNMAAFVSPGWLRKYVRGGGHTDYGLWMICYGEAMGCRSAVGNYLLGDWYMACQALVSCGLLIMMVSLAVSTVYVYTPRKSRNRSTAYVIVTSCTLSAFFMMVGTIIYGQKSMEAMTIANANAALFYSFGFAVTATVLTALSALLTIGDIREIMPDDL